MIFQLMECWWRKLSDEQDANRLPDFTTRIWSLCHLVRSHGPIFSSDERAIPDESFQVEFA